MTTKRQVIRQGAVYLAGTTVTQLVSLVAAVLTRRFMGPAQMGIWALLQIVVKYANYTSVGTFAAASREIPFNIGKGDLRQADRIKNTMFTYGLASTAAVAAALTVTACFLRSRIGPEIFWGLLLTGALLILQRLNNALITLLRATKKFDRAAEQMVLSAVFNAVLIAALSYRFKIYGYLAAMCLSFLGNCLYLFWKEDFRLRWEFDRKTFKGLAGYGMPLLVIGLIHTAFMSIDRFMIAGFLGLEAVGLYGIAILAASYVANVPNAMGVVLLPNFHEKYGQTETGRDLKRMATRTALLFSDAMPFLIGGVWIASETVIRMVLPDFLGCVPALKFLALSSFFLALSQPYHTYVIAVRRHWRLVPLLAAACGLAFALNWTVLERGYGIRAVAAAASGVMFFRFAANFWLASAELYGWRESLRHFFAPVLKFAVLTAVLLGLDAWVRLDNQALGISVKAALFLAAFAVPARRLWVEFSLGEALRKRLFPAKAAQADPSSSRSI